MSSKLTLKELSRYRAGTYADIVYRNALLFGDNEAFVYGKERVTFAEYNSRVNSLIHALKSMGVKKGDIIGVLSWNCLEYAYVIGAALKGGFILSPFNTRLQVEGLDYLINYSEASTLFVGPEFIKAAEQLRPRLPKVRHYIAMERLAPGMTGYHELLTDHSREEPDVQVEEDDPIYILYTSGTTGRPKGALYTHGRALQDAQTRVALASIRTVSRNILMLPLFHIAGIQSFVAFTYAGGTHIIVSLFDPEAVLKAIQDEKATDIQIVPTNLAAIFALPDFENYDLSSLKEIVYAGSPMPAALLKKGMDIWGPIFSQYYGQTESGPLISCLTREKHRSAIESPGEQKLLVSIGQPCVGIHVRVVDGNNNDVNPGEVGEIIVRSTHIMREYWHKPEETSKTIVDGWLHTGDIGYYDDKGHLYISDRKQDMIISGGENIYPREVEEVIYQHPAVHEAAVIGIPDPYWVERVHAVVSLKKGISLDGKELIEFCKQRIARYKAPKSVEFIEALPKNAAGKIQKAELRKRYRVGPE